MAHRVLIPWSLDGLPPSLDVGVYDGKDLPAGDLGEVEYYVLPYARRPEEDLLPRMPHLKALQTLSAGYDHLLETLPPGVDLHNGRGLHDASTAEHALALILAAQRHLPRWFAAQQAGHWDQDFVGSLADRKVLLVGAGSIGTAIAQRLAPFEVELTLVARHARPDEGVHAIGDLHALLPEAEIVVLVLPRTPETVGLIGKRELDLLPDGALLVNVGRGDAIDTQALLAENGRIRAALDVVDPEPLPDGHPLWSAPGVIVTPHVGGGSASFLPRAQRFVREQLRRFADGEELANRVVTG